MRHIKTWDTRQTENKGENSKHKSSSTMITTEGNELIRREQKISDWIKTNKNNKNNKKR